MIVNVESLSQIKERRKFARFREDFQRDHLVEKGEARYDAFADVTRRPRRIPFEAIARRSPGRLEGIIAHGYVEYKRYLENLLRDIVPRPLYRFVRC